jgi:hypothetical protein
MRARALLCASTAALLLAAGGGCAPSFAEGDTVTEVRVLAVRSEPAEVAPGAEAQLSALVVTPGDGTGVTLDWSLCLAPRSGAQPNPSPDACSDPAVDPALLAQVAAGQGPGDSYSLAVPALADLDPATVSLPDASGGVYLTVRLVAHHASDPDLVALYRLRLQLGQDSLNTNPSFDGVPLLDGKPWAEGDIRMAEPGAKLDLEAHWTDGSVEDYTFTLPDQPTQSGTETLSFAWFNDGGEIDPTHTGGAGKFQTDWTLPADAMPGTTLNLWVVLRDNRGGSTWLSRQVQVASP